MCVGWTGLRLPVWLPVTLNLSFSSLYFLGAGMTDTGLVYVVVWSGPRTLCMLGKHPTD